MEFSRIEKNTFSQKELLSHLSEKEQAFFLTCLGKLHEKSDIDRQALCVFLVDMLHDNHTEELATITSMLVNKFMSEPFLRDRKVLKNTLETIMGAITMGEELLGEQK